jgi:hypothetical protein
VLHIEQLVLPNFGLKKKICPSLEDVFMQRTSAKCGKKMMHLIKGHVTQQALAKCGKKMMPLIGGLYQTADFDQMWSNNVPLLEDFVSLQTLTKCGPKCAPCQRTLSHCGL